MSGDYRRPVWSGTGVPLSTLALIASTVIGCSGDNVGTAPLTSTTALFTVALNQHAINMALTGSGSTIQLTAVGYTATGTPVTDTIHPIFSASDSSVTVSATGLVTGHYVTKYGGTQVIATVQVHNVTYTDTAFIRVTSTSAPTPRTFSIQPSMGDTAFRTFDIGNYTPVVQSVDSAGDPVTFSTVAETGPENVFWLASSNPSVALVQRSSGNFFLQTEGHVTLYAESWVYGVTVKDSLLFTIGLPIHVYNIFDDNFDVLWDKYNILLGVGGVIDWTYYDGGSFDLIFDNPAAVDSAPNILNQTYTGSGNIHWPTTPPSAGNDQARRFPVAGVYHFHDLYNPTMIGTITVLSGTP